MSEYKHLESDQSLYSARRVIKQLESIITLPKSVLDVGCGVGGWSLAFKEAGVKNLILLDHPSNSRENLLFQENEFYTADFQITIPQVYKADLVICFEVLEHINPKYCHAVIEYLTKCSDTVLFSAAIPGQGGYNHVNENFSSYWEAIFEQFGFRKYDIVRPLILFDNQIEYFIRQNIFLYVKGKGLLHTTEHKAFLPPDFEIINRKILDKHKSPLALLKMMPGSFKKTMKLRFGKKK